MTEKPGAVVDCNDCDISCKEFKTCPVVKVVGDGLCTDENCNPSCPAWEKCSEYDDRYGGR